MGPDFFKQPRIWLTITGVVVIFFGLDNLLQAEQVTGDTFGEPRDDEIASRVGFEMVWDATWMVWGAITIALSLRTQGANQARGGALIILPILFFWEIPNGYLWINAEIVWYYSLILLVTSVLALIACIRNWNGELIPTKIPQG